MTKDQILEAAGCMNTTQRTQVREIVQEELSGRTPRLVLKKSVRQEQVDPVYERAKQGLAAMAQLGKQLAREERLQKALPEVATNIQLPSRDVARTAVTMLVQQGTLHPNRLAQLDARPIEDFR